jgi:energy-coupling factor transporter ATP-binding protein EcfA2
MDVLGTAAGAGTASTGPALKSFHCSGPVDPAQHYVVDRTALYDSLARKLEDGAYVLLHGARQSGKASAAQEVTNLLNTRTGGRIIALQCTLQAASPGNSEAMWAGVESRFRMMLKTVAAANMTVAELPIFKAAQSDQPLFTDVTSFINCFESTRWGDLSVVLVLNEFDVFLSTATLIKDQFLSALRAIKVARQSVPPPAGKTDGTCIPAPYALLGVLATGVHRLLRLVAERNAEGSNSIPPFNVEDAEEVPEVTEEQVICLVEDVNRDRAINIPPEVSRSLHWWSGGHAGLLSFLCRALLRWMESCNTKELSISQWCMFCASSYLLGETYSSATISSVIQAVRGNSTPESEAARGLLRCMLSHPVDEARDLSTYFPTYEKPLDYLLSEGILVRVYNASTNLVQYRIAAPLLLPFLKREIGSNALAAPSAPFVRLPDGQVDLKATLWQIVPYMGMESLKHPLVRNKSGLPSADAYHFALESLLCTRSSEDGWRVLNETRSSCISHPGHLDIVIASNGQRCGIHLLAEGDRFGPHVANAATYMIEQGIQRLLVVNFATHIDNIVSECPVPPAEGVDVVQVLLNF